MLSIATQAHLGYGYIMAPLSLVMLGMAWWQFSDQRRTLVRNTALGGALLILSLVPWGIGLIEAGMGTNEIHARTENTGAEWGRVQGSVSYIISATGYWPVQRFQARPGEWWPPLMTDDILRVKTWITLIGSLGLLVLFYRRRWEAAPGVILALLLFWPLTSYLVSPVDILDYYLMPMYFGVYAVQGVIFARAAQARPWARWPVLAVFVVFLVLQSWLVVGMFRWYHVGGNLERYRMSMDDMLHALDSWRAEAAQVVVITDTTEAKFTPDNQIMWWEVLGAYDGPVTVAMPQGIPIDPAGEVIAGSWAGATIPALFGEGEPQGQINNGEPMFRKVVIPPDYHLSLDYVPENLNRYANGIRIEGLHLLTDLEPGSTWRMILVWSPERKGDTTQYQFSVRAVVGEQTYAQTDIASLFGGLWRPGDSVINLVDLPLPAAMPLEDVHIQLISYSWPEMATVSAIDDDGNPVAPWLFLVPSAE